MPFELSPRIDTALVLRLIAEQFPQWRNPPARPVERSGWDNRSFRLGSLCLLRRSSVRETPGFAQVDLP